MRTSEGTIIAAKKKKKLAFLIPPHLLTDFQI